MQCCKLQSFVSTSKRWDIMLCRAARLPYVPSLEELEKLCSGKQHRSCHILHEFLREKREALRREYGPSFVIEPMPVSG